MSPAYIAVMLCVPAASAEVENVTVSPDIGRFIVLRIVVPSRKLTAPEGAAYSLPSGSVTVAISVTACPAVAGLGETVSAVAVVAPTPWPDSAS